jgi:hypothetical protein
MSPASLHTFFSHVSPALAVAAPYIAFAALLLALACLVLVLLLRRRFMRLALGRHGSLEETLAILTRDTKELQLFRTELEKYLKSAEMRLRGSVQGIGVVRFNAFAGAAAGGGAGGNQSFSVALLDEEHSGVVFSTLYSRNHVGVYAKPVDKGNSTFELTAEERDAIAKAKHSVAGHKKHTKA